MSYFFSTRSGTTYMVEDTENPQVQLLTGGRFDKQTIYKRVRQAEALCPTRTQKQTDLEYE